MTTPRLTEPVSDAVRRAYDADDGDSDSALSAAIAQYLEERFAVGEHPWPDWVPLTRIRAWLRLAPEEPTNA